MQAIARVNRVFRDKPGGLVVDYLGLADQLKSALATYTQSGGKGDPSIDTTKAIAVMLEKHEIACGMMHGFDWSKWKDGTPVKRSPSFPVRKNTSWNRRTVKNVSSKWSPICRRPSRFAPRTEEAIAIRDDIGFFQAVKAALAKPRGQRKTELEELDHAVRQLVAKAIAPEVSIIDVFKRQAQAARHKHPVRSVPGRGARTQIQERRRGAARKVA